MASNHASESLKDLCECPVCLQHYKDPRLLKCGHQFCEKCLEDIAKRHPRGHVKCPICRYVTELQNRDVTSLPRAILLTHMQEIIFRQPTEEAVGQKCTKCKIEKPSRHCLECKSDLAYLCDRCFTGHQQLPRLANHKTVTFDPVLVYREHPHRMVECFCHQCSQVACEECLFESHVGHSTEDLKPAAEKSRKTLQDYKKTQELKFIDMKIIEKINQTKSDLISKQSKLVTEVQKVKQSWLPLEKRLDQVVKEVDKETQLNLQKLSDHENKIQEVSARQEKILKLCESLLSADTPAPQVILSSRDLPQQDKLIPSVQVDIPVIGDMFDNAASHLDKTLRDINIKYTKRCISVWTHPEWNRGIKLNGAPRGLTFHSDRTQFLTRIKDKNEPVRIYSTDGSLVKSLGKNIAGVYNAGGYSQISYDPVRELILLPCESGELIRLDLKGKEKDRAGIGQKLADLAYVQEQDLYVLTDNKAGAVYLVSPDKLNIIKTLIQPGTLKYPGHISVGKVDDKDVVVVSSQNPNKLYLNSLTGKVVDTFGPKAGDLGDPGALCGLAIDSRGRVIVCDYDNARMLRVWRENGEEHWEILLDEKELTGKPWGVVIDNIERQLRDEYRVTK